MRILIFCNQAEVTRSVTMLKNALFVRVVRLGAARRGRKFKSCRIDEPAI